MADLLIKGMKMPECCTDCDFHNPFYGSPYCRRLMRKISLKGRLENCPLVEVTKSVDVVPIRHGRWVGIDDYPFETWECDRCGHIENGDDVQERCHYCPNCGAIMDGDDNA